MHNWRIKFALFLIYVVFAMLLNSVGTVILQVMGNYDLRHVDAAILEAFKDLPIAVVSLLVASFLPRLGFRRAMMLGLAIVTGACIAMPLVPAFLTTKLLFLCVGASFALVKVSVYATVGLITDDAKEHASTMNTLEGMFMIGVLMGYWIFAQFVSVDDPKSQEWLNVYWLLAGLAAITIVVLFFTPYDESGSKLENAGRTLGDDFVGMLRLVVRPVAYVFVISAFLYVLIEQGIGTWLPTFNKEILHLPTDMAIEAGIIFSGTLAIGRLSAGAVLARFDWYPVLNCCLVAMGVLVLLVLPLTHGVIADANITWLTAPPAAYIFPLIGLFMAPIYPAINSVVLSALPRHQHAAMTGLIVIFSALGGTTGSLITGRVFGAFGGQTAFYFSLVPMVGILIALYFFRRETRRTGEAVAGEA
ncbi:MFS transporter [Gimibacter soli]|uniref:MFS transporter n=1 Tax=Gimibacter soli TaxID=3024400 RepID=A0AAE9XX92_9PROT|nr:MFS transporter [Gimibacter soli]WCL55269.1 MFS transporter [Gimibacter soli]